MTTETTDSLICAFALTKVCDDFDKGVEDKTYRENEAFRYLIRKVEDALATRVEVNLGHINHSGKTNRSITVDLGSSIPSSYGAVQLNETIYDLVKKSLTDRGFRVERGRMHSMGLQIPYFSVISGEAAADPEFRSYYSAIEISWD